jgi:hypothetical protein
MLQVLHLHVSKVDRVLRMRCVWEARGGVSGPHVGAGDTGAVERRSGNTGPHVDARKRTAATGVRPNVGALAGRLLFRWNLTYVDTYVDLLWDQNTIRSLTSTSQIVLHNMAILFR